ncbi:hypothetical protein BKA81DRAFT_355076 [Phyllosticta paracitricarpa]
MRPGQPFSGTGIGTLTVSDGFSHKLSGQDLRVHPGPALGEKITVVRVIRRHVQYGVLQTVHAALVQTKTQGTAPRPRAPQRGGPGIEAAQRRGGELHVKSMCGKAEWRQSILWVQPRRVRQHTVDDGLPRTLTQGEALFMRTGQKVGNGSEGGVSGRGFRERETKAQGAWAR